MASEEAKYSIFLFKDVKSVFIVPDSYISKDGPTVTCAWPMACENVLDFPSFVKKYESPVGDEWVQSEGRVIKEHLTLKKAKDKCLLARKQLLEKRKALKDFYSDIEIPATDQECTMAEKRNVKKRAIFNPEPAPTKRKLKKSNVALPPPPPLCLDQKKIMTKQKAHIKTSVQLIKSPVKARKELKSSSEAHLQENESQKDVERSGEEMENSPDETLTSFLERTPTKSGGNTQKVIKSPFFQEPPPSPMRALDLSPKKRDANQRLASPKKTFPLTEASFQKCCLSAILKIDTKIDSLYEEVGTLKSEVADIRDIMKQHQQESAAEGGMDNSDPVMRLDKLELPISNKENFGKFEDSLNNKSIKNDIKTFIRVRVKEMGVQGRDLDLQCRYAIETYILPIFFSDGFIMMCSKSGQRGNVKIEGTKFIEVLTEGLRESRAFKGKGLAKESVLKAVGYHIWRKKEKIKKMSCIDEKPKSELQKLNESPKKHKKIGSDSLKQSPTKKIKIVGGKSSRTNINRGKRLAQDELRTPRKLRKRHQKEKLPVNLDSDESASEEEDLILSDDMDEYNPEEEANGSAEDEGPEESEEELVNDKDIL